jgi:stage II sporulation protein D
VRRPSIVCSPATAWAAAAVAAWFAAASCRTVQVPPPRGGAVSGSLPVPTAPPPMATPTPGIVLPPPVVRAGILIDVPRVSIGADSGVVVRVAGRPEPIRLARATFASASNQPPSPPRYRVQVASLADERGARALAERVQQTTGLVPSVEPSVVKAAHQVRVGDYATRDEALRLANRLGRSGLSGSWVVEERPLPGAGGRLRLLETGDEMEAATIEPAVAVEILSADASPYRGLLEVRASEGSALTVINIANIEDYLRGVVPNELSPQAFPQAEALKAQAVAARSYVLNHKGEFEKSGYDICATPACQVYKGESTETPATDRAVAETRGLVVTYRGRPINAYYTSTCGGHTEDAENMFDGEAIPYLKGVACAPETKAWSTLKTKSAPREVPGMATAGRDIALLLALGVLEPRTYSAPVLAGVPSDSEVRGWASRLETALHRRGCDAHVSGALARRGHFVQYLVGTLCWEERGRRLLAPQDPEYLLMVEDRQELGGEGERLAAAVLVQEGVLSPFPDNTLRPGAVLTRAEAMTLLARAAEKAGLPGLVSADFAGASGGQITVMRGETPESYPVDGTARFFRSLDGVPAAASELTLRVGDKVSFVLENGVVSFLEAEQTRKGASADRSSRYYRWEVRLTPGDVAKSLVRYGSVGKVKDVVPRRLGVSGRVVELSVLGSDGEVVLKGLRVRWGMNLRENLFVVDREFDPQGQVERFVITGKGWGHGVGLCQVGAFGMALAGSTFEEILQHYYSGVALQKAYD